MPDNPIPSVVTTIQLKPAPNLFTKRLLLRPFVESDWEAFLTSQRNPAMYRWELIAKELTEEEYRKSFESHSQVGYLYEKGFWAASYAVVTRDDNQVIGMVDCCPWTTEDHERHFGFHIDESCWNRGYGTEAGIALLDFVFACGVKEVVSGCFEGNTASVRALTKIGFRQTPLKFSDNYIRRWLLPRGRLKLHFSLTAEQWSAKR